MAAATLSWSRWGSSAKCGVALKNPLADPRCWGMDPRNPVAPGIDLSVEVVLWPAVYRPTLRLHPAADFPVHVLGGLPSHPGNLMES